MYEREIICLPENLWIHGKVLHKWLISWLNFLFVFNLFDDSFLNLTEIIFLRFVIYLSCTYDIFSMNVLMKLWFSFFLYLLEILILNVVVFLKSHYPIKFEFFFCNFCFYLLVYTYVNHNFIWFSIYLKVFIINQSVRYFFILK